MTLERVIDWLLYLKDVKRHDRLSVKIDYEILLEIIDFLQELQSCRDTGLTPEQINRLKEGVGISDRKHGRWEEVVHPADGLFGLYQPYTKCSECGREVIGLIDILRLLQYQLRSRQISSII